MCYVVPDNNRFPQAFLSHRSQMSVLWRRWFVSIILHIRHPALRSLTPSHHKAIAQLLNLLDTLPHRTHLTPPVLCRHIRQDLKRAPELLDVTHDVTSPLTSQLARLGCRHSRKTHQFTKDIENAVNVVVGRESNVGWHCGLGLRRGDEGLVAEVVCEREGLNEFFQAAKGGGVAVTVDVLQIGGNAVEKFGDFFKACVHILLNVRWEVFVEMLDSVACEQLLTKIDGILIELTSEGQKCYSLVSNCSNL